MNSGPVLHYNRIHSAGPIEIESNADQLTDLRTEISINYDFSYR